MTTPQEPTKSDAPLVNRVAQSGLVTLDLEDYYPRGEIVAFDLKPFLFRELILKEKDFREQMAQINWADYTAKHIAVHCSTDAIIPMWAFMLVATQASPYAAGMAQCAPEQYAELHFLKTIAALPTDAWLDKRIIVKGCSDKPVLASAYLEITRVLTPVARSIMYGEPCSTVPVYKKKMGE